MDETTVSIIFNLLAAEVGDEKMKSIIARKYVSAFLTPTITSEVKSPSVTDVMNLFAGCKEKAQVIDEIYEEHASILMDWIDDCGDYIPKGDIRNYVSLGVRGEDTDTIEVFIEVDD